MLGGAALVLFATVAVVGIQTLGKVDFTDHRNLIIVTTSLALALLVTSYPGDRLGTSGGAWTCCSAAASASAPSRAIVRSTSCSSISGSRDPGWPAAGRSSSTRSTP